jgi:YVTN family beta-propeller protein
VNSVQFVDTWLPPAAIAALGGPTAEGLPPGENALKLTLASEEGGALRLQWTGPPGWFEVQKATRLNPPDWEVASNPTSNHTIALPVDGEAAFYRVLQSEANMTVGQSAGGAQSLPSMQLVRAAGDQIQFSGRPVDLALAPDSQTVYLKNMSSLLVVDAKTWKLRQTLPYPGNGASMHGIAVAQDGRRVYVTGSGNELYEWRVDTNGMAAFSRTISLPVGSYPCGIALFRNGEKAAVCLSVSNRLAIVNLSTGTILSNIRVGIAPWDVVLSPDESTAYVSDWGGRWPGANDLTAPSAGTSVVVDERGIGASGVVSFVDLSENRELSQAPAGLHPSDLELTSDGRTLFVANANSDTVTLIDTATRSVRENILVRPDDEFPYGSAPTGLALSSDGSRLFVALGGNNCVAVVDLSTTPGGSSVAGFLPTDWYPGAIAAADGHLYVVNVKGLGSRLGQPTATSYQIGAYLGTANRISIPDGETLNKLSAQSFEDGRVPVIRRTHQRGAASTPPVPVPTRLGEPSVFNHVLYILKENKTYDQMFGDIKEGNGDPNLCIYPEFVSPNHHALARQYVLLDNFYCNGVNSSDGHSWSTEANVTDHLEKSFGGFTRSYSFGDDPLTYSSSGFIWDNVLRHGLTFRNYGEMDYASPSKNETWLQIYDDFVSGRRSVRYLQNIGIENLRRYSSTNVPGWNMGIPDVVRADGFIRELRQAEARGTWETFSFLYLPNDHTGGPPTPRAQMADNDLALGQVVEAVTRSRFATNTVIFVMEDDPQSGYDHVDAHRSICLVISPYTRRNAVVSKFYNQAGVIHTMERILGLPPMNQQDAMAPIMFECFTNVPNFSPYTALTNNVPLDEGARKVGVLTPEQLYWASQLKKMDFSKPDRIDDDLFNRYIWFANKGNAAYPEEFVGAHGKGLSQLGLLLTPEGAEEED